eukprot:2568888-Alexandrium_andersonii.AAC.1
MAKADRLGLFADRRRPDPDLVLVLGQPHGRLVHVGLGRRMRPASVANGLPAALGRVLGLRFGLDRSCDPAPGLLGADAPPAAVVQQPLGL